MGKRRAGWNEERYLRELKSGVSQGTGSDYTPGITIHDFPSQGISCRVPGMKTNRPHHCLSRNEEYYLIIQENDPDVLDIWEQFLLRLTETLEIAELFNIRHPYQGSFPCPVSTDFVIQRKDGIQARTIKETKDLDDPRVLEKFSIECEYWRRHNIDWKVVSEKEINRDLARNYQWLNAGPRPADLIPDEELREDAASLLLELIDEDEFAFSGMLEIVEEGLDLPHGSAITLFKELVLTRRILLDLNRPINFMNPFAKED